MFLLMPSSAFLMPLIAFSMLWNTFHCFFKAFQYVLLISNFVCLKNFPSVLLFFIDFVAFGYFSYLFLMVFMCFVRFRQFFLGFIQK